MKTNTLGVLIGIFVYILSNGTGCKLVPYSSEVPLTEKQQEYLHRYIHWRSIVAARLNLPSDAPADIIRVRAAEYLGLPPQNREWNDFFGVPWIAASLNEKTRRKCADVFFLPPDATWVAIKDYVEQLRRGATRRKAPSPRGGRVSK